MNYGHVRFNRKHVDTVERNWTETLKHGQHSYVHATRVVNLRTHK